MPDLEALQEALGQARQHAENSRADIANAGSRQEHMRLTALALEASTVVRSLEAVMRLALRDNLDAGEV